MHTVRRVLQELHLVHAAPTATVLDVAALMSEAHVGCIPVLEGEQLVGVFSERDLMTRVVVEGKDASETLVDARERDHRLRVGGVETQRRAQALRGRGKIVGLLA